jgi:hypothetical protein
MRRTRLPEWPFWTSPHLIAAETPADIAGPARLYLSAAAAHEAARRCLSGLYEAPTYGTPEGDALLEAIYPEVQATQDVRRDFARILAEAIGRRAEWFPVDDFLIRRQWVWFEPVNKVEERSRFSILNPTPNRRRPQWHRQHAQS